MATPIEKYLLGEATLEETKKALGIKVVNGIDTFDKKAESKLFDNDKLHPIHKKIPIDFEPRLGELMFPKEKKETVIVFKVTKSMRNILEILAECNQRSLTNTIECIIRDYFSRMK